MYATTRTKRDAEIIAQMMERDTKTAVTIFKLDKSAGGGYRVQHNDLGYSWFEKNLPGY